MLSRLQTRPLAAVALLVALAAVLPARAAQDLPAPTGAVVLTVSGKIEHTTDGTVAAFDMAALQALDHSTITTSTTWLSGVKTFEGVNGAVFLKAIGATGTTVNAVAADGYSVAIPIEDFAGGALLIAYAMDGKPMAPDEQGPLWIVYPYDSDPQYQTEAIIERSIWQLTALEVR